MFPFSLSTVGTARWQRRAEHGRARPAWSSSAPATWQRIGIIIGVLLLSAAFGYQISLRVAAVVIALPVGITALLHLLHKPYLGPPALIVTGLIANATISDNFNPTVLLLSFLSVLWLFDMVVHKAVLEAHLAPPVRPLLWLVGSALLAFLLGQLPWFPTAAAPLSAQIGGVAVYVLSACAFLMVGHYVKELRWLQWMVWLLIIIGSLYVFGRILPRPFRLIIQLFPWGSTSCLFWLWLSAHTFSQLLFNHTLGAARRAFLATLLIATLYAVVVQTFDWKSGWLPVLVVIGAIVGLRWPRLLIILGIGGLFVTPYVVTKLVAGDEYSYSTRVDAWILMLKIIQANPIIGLGPSNYYWYSSLFAIRGYSVNFNSHNQYIDLVAQTGLIGLFCYLWFFAVVGRVGWRLRRRVPAGFAQAYLYGSLGGLVGMLVAGVLGDWVLPFVYNVGLVGMRSSLLGWLFLGGIITLARLYGDWPAAQDGMKQASAPGA